MNIHSLVGSTNGMKGIRARRWRGWLCVETTFEMIKSSIFAGPSFGSWLWDIFDRVASIKCSGILDASTNVPPSCNKVAMTCKGSLPCKWTRKQLPWFSNVRVGSTYIFDFYIHIRVVLIFRRPGAFCILLFILGKRTPLSTAIQTLTQFRPSLCSVNLFFPQNTE